MSYTRAATFNGKSGNPDYGTGKTFLLRDLVHALREDLDGKVDTLAAIPVVCTENDPLSWYRSEVAGALAPSMLEDIMARLYARAGATIASEAKLTEAAVNRLNQEPRAIYGLINQHLLNKTAADRELEALLVSKCSVTQGSVRSALRGLVWAQTSAIASRWILGEELDAHSLDMLQVSAPLENESEVAGVLSAIAAIHGYLRLPFALLIDELEHFTRYDAARQSSGNATWLKRLLEQLSNSPCLVVVAGHWNAWEGHSDYLDRFSREKPIGLVRLDAKDITEIVHTWAHHTVPHDFDSKMAEAVVELTEGNLRRVLSLLRVIFDATNGYQLPLAPAAIARLSEQIGQKISTMDATLHIHELLERRGFRVQAPGTAVGIGFDLIGHVGGKPRLLVAVKHAQTASELAGQAKQFLGRMQRVHAAVPDAIGWFVADGDIDPQVLTTVANNKLGLFSFDLTQKEVLKEMAVALETLSGANPLTSVSDGNILRGLAAENENLLTRLVEAQRVKDSELIDRLVEQQHALEERFHDLMTSQNSKDSAFTEHLSRQQSAFEERGIARLSVESRGSRVTHFTTPSCVWQAPTWTAPSVPIL